MNFSFGILAKVLNYYKTEPTVSPKAEAAHKTILKQQLRYTKVGRTRSALSAPRTPHTRVVFGPHDFRRDTGFFEDEPADLSNMYETETIDAKPPGHGPTRPVPLIEDVHKTTPPKKPTRKQPTPEEPTPKEPTRKQPSRKTKANTNPSQVPYWTRHGPMSTLRPLAVLRAPMRYVASF